MLSHWQDSDKVNLKLHAKADPIQQFRRLRNKFVIFNVFHLIKNQKNETTHFWSTDDHIHFCL